MNFMMTDDERQSFADLAEGVARSLLAFAERIRTADAAGISGTPTAVPEADAAAPASTPKVGRLGARQLAILEALRAAESDGLTTSEVAQAVGIAATNAPTALKALAERGLVTRSDTSPAVWRCRDQSQEP